MQICTRFSSFDEAFSDSILVAKRDFVAKKDFVVYQCVRLAISVFSLNFMFTF